MRSVAVQARMQEMKWGVFFVKKLKIIGGVFFCKKWTFSQRRVHYVQYQYFLFYVLLIWGCVRTQRTPLPTGLWCTVSLCVCVSVGHNCELC